MQLEFVVMGVPKGKGRPRMTRSGHTYTPNDTVQYENLVKTCFVEKYPDWVPSEEVIQASIIAYYPIPKSFSAKKLRMIKEGDLLPAKKPDLDNIAKAILDSLNNIAYKDDSQVCQLTMLKQYDDRPRVEVTLKEVI